MNRLKPLLVLTSLCLPLLAARTTPKYIPLEFERMALTADLVVHGKIREIRERTFLLEIETRLVGEIPRLAQESGVLEVVSFQNWTCAARWCPYSVGQEVVLFLEERGEERKAWHIQSGGGEGEMPVVLREDEDGSEVKRVVIRGSKPKGLGRWSRSKAFGAELVGVEVDLAEFVEAVSGLRRCFEVRDAEAGSGNAMRRYGKTRLLVETAQIVQLAGRSQVARYLVNKALLQSD